MKRINPATNQPFRLGDERSDGYLFYGYTARVKNNGYYVEIWLNPDSKETIRLKDLARKKKKYDNPVLVPN